MKLQAVSGLVVVGEWENHLQWLKCLWRRGPVGHIFVRWNAECGESRTLGVERGKRRRSYQSLTYRYQNVEDLLESDYARKMLSNSEFIMMLNQATADRVKLGEILNISPTQLGYVTNASAGQGLLFAGNSIVPFVDKFPEDTKMYQMMTTKFSDTSGEENE